MKNKKCPRCGYDGGMPFHTCTHPVSTTPHDDKRLEEMAEQDKISRPVPLYLWAYLSYQYPACAGDILLKAACEEISQLKSQLQSAKIIIDANHRLFEFLKNEKGCQSVIEQTCVDTVTTLFRLKDTIYKSTLEDNEKLSKELQSARRDVERLDWLEKNECSMNKLRYNRDSVKESWHLYWTPKGQSGCNHFGSADTALASLRQAVDAAITHSKEIE